MYAAPDLDQGIEEIADLTGVRPALGGSHPGIGTRNALLSLGEDQYLEIIAPDHNQKLSGTTGELLLEHGGSGIRGWAVATTDLHALTELASKAGFGYKDIIEMSRTTQGGVHLEWQLRFLTGNNQLPFFIDWKASPHPALSTPKGCSLIEFCIATQEVAKYQQLMSALDLEVSMTSDGNRFKAALQTPKGIVELGNW
tara:strand:- start:2047 stop:2640 length:594 start_codon:yes stop_codon:yes gene_type:complete